MPDREIRATVKLLDDEGLDQATLNSIRRGVLDSMREKLNERVVLGEPKLSCGLAQDELIEKRCKDAIRQCGLPQSLRRLPPFYPRR